MRSASQGAGIPLGEFADALAGLMPGLHGPGARRSKTHPTRSTRKRRAPGRQPRTSQAGRLGGRWSRRGRCDHGACRRRGREWGRADTVRPPRPPQTRASGDPLPALASDGTPVIRYPFQLRSNGNRVRIAARIEVMANDGAQVETDAPVGAASRL